MTVASLNKRLNKLQSKLPKPRFNLGHMRLSDLERIEGHFLAGLSRMKPSGRSSGTPVTITMSLLDHEG
ncbi:MAG: hypothetical protein M3Y27_31560, partial [Acidobacteriota bacterium]|nr:hypothetical protein [Acidobacteriota bacterium]